MIGSSGTLFVPQMVVSPTITLSRPRDDVGNDVRNLIVTISLSSDRENVPIASIRLGKIETGVTIRS